MRGFGTQRLCRGAAVCTALPEWGWRTCRCGPGADPACACARLLLSDGLPRACRGGSCCRLLSAAGSFPATCECMRVCNRTMDMVHNVSISPPKCTSMALSKSGNRVSPSFLGLPLLWSRMQNHRNVSPLYVGRQETRGRVVRDCNCPFQAEDMGQAYFDGRTPRAQLPALNATLWYTQTKGKPLSVFFFN